MFDISKPQHVSPDPTSRPVIVGHHPTMSDPMVRERPHSHSAEPPKVTNVPVITEGEATSALTEEAPAPTGLIEHRPPAFSMPETAPELAGHPEPMTPITGPEPAMPAELVPQAPTTMETPPEAPFNPLLPIDNAPQATEANQPPYMPMAPMDNQAVPSHEVTPHMPPAPHPTEPALPPQPQVDTSHLAGSLTVSHSPGAGPQTGYWRKPLLGLAVVILLIIGYGIADAKTSLPLPFHPFRQAKVADTEATDVPAVTPTPQPTPPPTATDPYASWKTYCDTPNKLCFKYPQDWGTNTAKTADITNFELFYPQTQLKVRISYVNPDTKDGSLANYYTVSTTELSEASSKLQIIGGYFADNKLPAYSLVDKSLLKPHPLTIGKSSSFMSNPHFNTDVRLEAYPVGVEFKTAKQAQEWFSTPEAKIALKILQSIYFK